MLAVLLGLCLAAPGGYHWDTRDPAQHVLRKDGVQVGNYWTDGPWKGQYRHLSGGRFTEPCPPPVVPANAAPAPPAPPRPWDDEPAGPDTVQMMDGHTAPTGVLTSEPPDQGEYRLGGHKVSRAQAMDAIRGAPMPDYKTRAWLTVIGPKDFRDKVLAEVAASELKDKVVARDYDPADPKEAWALDPGFVKDKPQVLLQAPDGKVLLRPRVYEGLTPFIEALRKPKPYDPDKDPDGKPAPIPLPEPLKNVPWWAWPAGATGLAFLVAKKR